MLLDEERTTNRQTRQLSHKTYREEKEKGLK